ncbi:SAM-dependent methyltransferase [Herbaspirillum lusitanum]|uniref:Chemotaxis protein methyltransferase n=1 Tax=Herbaspirillum lusitanum TaxID=213312 RepID=A0ABW9A973_9BURK
MFNAPAPIDIDVSDQEMQLFQQLFRQHVGLHLPDSKKALLHSRLAGRMNELRLGSLGEYHALIARPSATAERQRAIDLITTNETYFFREQRHFDFLKEQLLPTLGIVSHLKVWSAASSSGEEAYSLAMLLGEQRRQAAWSVFASDISQRVLSFGRRGLYPMARGQNIPEAYLKRYCLCGTGKYEGHFLIAPELRRKVQFEQRNLMDLSQDADQQYDIIFLRNVIIYFDFETKVEVIRAVTRKLKQGGHLIVGHSESLHGMPLDLQMLSPSIYWKSR